MVNGKISFSVVLITSIREVMFSPLSVYLSAGLYKKCWTDLQQTWGHRPGKTSFNFGADLDHLLWIRFFFRCLLFDIGFGWGLCSLTALLSLFFSVATENAIKTDGKETGCRSSVFVQLARYRPCTPDTQSELTENIFACCCLVFIFMFLSWISSL